MQKLLDRFIDYVRFDTRPDESSDSSPSSQEQYKFAERLAEELKSLGLSDVTLDDNGYIMATLPSNTRVNYSVVGFVSHMDTSPEAPSVNITPQVHRGYDGNEIILDKARDIKLSPREFPELKDYKGQTLITTDGSTLLGADDKAGIAEIVTAMEYLLEHPELKHGRVRIAFTPDEEIGRGADKFDVSAFGADYAYTVDGGRLGELEYENFNAAAATLTIRGRGVHPGTAKGKMINSLQLAKEFDSLLPGEQKPEHTAGYEGFFHLYEMAGTVEKSVMKYIIRDHDPLLFADRKRLFYDTAAAVQKGHPGAEINVSMKDQYFNMKEIIEQNFFIVDEAIKSYRRCGIEPEIKPVRGGTDGARLSFMGLPCPNIFTGGHNYHSRFEYIPLESMEKAVQVIINLSLSKLTSKK